MKKGLRRRNTRQRRVILEALRRTNTHPTAGQLLSVVKRSIPNISFATVYRNLNLLKAQGEALELVCSKHGSRYDGCIKNHYHFFCIKCGKVFDVPRPVLKGIDKETGMKLGFVVRYHRVDFYGYCGGCKKQGKKGG